MLCKADLAAPSRPQLSTKRDMGTADDVGGYLHSREFRRRRESTAAVGVNWRQLI